MDLKQLEYFVRVAEAGSFTKAAALLNIAQPAISRQVNQLEESLQTRLFTRNGRGAVPTEEGERLLAHSRSILNQVARAREELESMQGKSTGKVSLGMPASIASYILVPLIKSIKKALPAAELIVHQGRSAELQEWLISGKVDFAVMYDVPFSPFIEKVHLATANLVLIQSHGSVVTAPIPLQDLHNIPLLIQCQPNTSRMLVELEMRRLGRTPRIVMEIDNIRTIVELVKEGYGAAIVSPRAVQEAGRAKGLTIRPIIEPELKLELSLAIPVRPLPKTHKTVIAIIKEIGRTNFELLPHPPEQFLQSNRIDQSEL
jgi:LysR family transcriptional regulator, nitrogen assimilation regulatory protein